MLKENFIKLHFSSYLTEGYLEDLKNLMFFNHNQSKVVPGILESVKRYGLPKLTVQNGIIKIRVGDIVDVQTIFVLNNSSPQKNLVGVIIYFRESTDNLMLLHIAIKEEYSFHSSRKDLYILFKMIEKLKSVASRISGIKTISILYNKDISKKIKI